MADLLYLVHRLPYPPDKGDKVRSYHLLKHLAASHRVFLGTFIDDPDDEQHIERVRSMCAGLHVARIVPNAARLRSLKGLFRGEALTLGFYRDAGMTAWVKDTVEQQRVRTALVFSSSMAQYIEPKAGVRLLVDFVDVDSAKWTRYAREHRAPLSWLYRREGSRLVDYERAVSQRAERSFFVTENEAELFRRVAPESALNIEAICNGVDADFFAPDPSRSSPFEVGEIPIVFTGAMDYWPNIDAVSWFASQVLPGLRKAWPTLRFHVVGRNPSAVVRGLKGEGIDVTGTVDDVRPYLQHAAVVVAPLRLARGIQNKVLEAMAMGRPVVASPECARAIESAGPALISASDAHTFVTEISALLAAPTATSELGHAARRFVRAHYDWSARLTGFDRHLVAKNT